LRCFWGYWEAQSDGHCFLLGLLHTLKFLSLFAGSFFFIFVTLGIPAEITILLPSANWGHHGVA
jgi:hypothetical protein